MRYLVFATIFVFFQCKSSEKVVVPPKNETVVMDYSKQMHYAIPVNFDALLEFAKEKEKPIFMEFVADWCLPCKVMETSTFKSEQVTDLMNRKFINYRIDYDSEEGKSLALLFQATTLPSLYFKDHRGRIIIQYQGQLNSEDMVNMTNQAYSIYEEQFK